MTIQKKIMFSNIVATTITALMICIICVAYVHFHSETLPNEIRESSGGVHFHSETLPNEIRESSGGVNKLTKIMNILYTYESEIFDMNWEIVLPEGEEETELLLLPESQRIEELESLGYHIRVESPYIVSFSNMDDQEKHRCS